MVSCVVLPIPVVVGFVLALLVPLLRTLLGRYAIVVFVALPALLVLLLASLAGRVSMASRCASRSTGCRS